MDWILRCIKTDLDLFFYTCAMFNSLTRVCLGRFQKEAVSSHLSPVKKRAKENTPPNTTTNAAQVSAHTADWQRGSTTSKTSSYKTQRQTIVIPDTPSPAVSVITISSDSDSEDERKCSGSPHGSVGWLSYSLIRVLI